MKIHTFDLEYSAGRYREIENTPKIWLMQYAKDAADRIADKVLWEPFVKLVEKHFWEKPSRRKPVGLINYWMKHDRQA